LNANAMHPRTFAIKISAKENKRKKAKKVFKINEDINYETNTRRILSIDKLFDVSVVDVPAYEATEIYARSEQQFEKEKKKYEANKLKLEKEKLKLLLSL